MDESLLRDIALFILLVVGGMMAGQWVRRWRLRDVLVDPRQVHERLRDGDDLLVLDVRTEGEFARGHAPGAVNVPLGVLPRRLVELKELMGDYQDTPVVLVCRTDNRAAVAHRHLKRHGFENVLVMQGGMTRWGREGLPVSRD